jgi:hypothetical protein
MAQPSSSPAANLAIPWSGDYTSLLELAEATTSCCGCGSRGGQVRAALAA